MRGKKIAAFITACALAASVIPSIPVKASESLYQTAEMDTTIQGPDDRTYANYRFTMEKSGRINITLNRPNEGSYINYIAVYEADGEIKGEELSIKYAVPSGTNVYAWDILKGDYIFYVDGNTYSLTFTPEYSDSTFEESLDDENYNENTAKKVDFNKTIKGALSMNETDGDFYKVKVGSKGTIKATVNSKAEDGQMVVYKLGKTPQTFQLMKGKNVNKVKLDSKGTYYIVIRKGYSGTGDYNFKLKFSKK